MDPFNERMSVILFSFDIFFFILFSLSNIHNNDVQTRVFLFLCQSVLCAERDIGIDNRCRIIFFSTKKPFTIRKRVN